MDKIILQGDQVMFQPTMGAATLIGNLSMPINGSGKMTVTGKKVCLEGDEKKVQLPINYIQGPYSIPGMGILKITGLAGDQLSKKTVNNKALILKGSKFQAEMQVTAPAQQPTAAGPVPDGTPKYSGMGQFITSNIKCDVT